MANVTISKGNKKMGAIPSVSLPPVVTCAQGCACAKKCYAVKLCRIYSNVRDSYARNLETWENNPREYWEAVHAVMAVNRFFRLHVSGDIPNEAYLRGMIYAAQRFPHCDILVFTKKYSLVNDYIANSAFAPAYALPKNLHIIFSEWPGMEMQNPYNLPESHVIFKGEEPREGWQICSGNCTECALHGVGCWSLAHGEHVAFYEH